jgi:hypothetical protein
LRRQHITHLFAHADNFTQVRNQLRVVYQNPAFRLGGRRFFREPPVEATVVYALLPADQKDQFSDEAQGNKGDACRRARFV